MFECFPNGESIFNQFVALSALKTNFESSLSSFTSLSGSVKYEIIAASGEHVNTRTVNITSYLVRSGRLVFIDLIERAELFAQAENLLPDNVLTFAIEVTLAKRMINHKIFLTIFIF